jgi:hypothetical protein
LTSISLKESNTDDEMAVDVVWCEPVSRQIPVNREKYREFSQESGRPRLVSPVKMGHSSISCTLGSIRNREFRRAYQGIFCAIRIRIRDLSMSDLAMMRSLRWAAVEIGESLKPAAFVRTNV